MFAYSITREHPSYPATGFYPLPALLRITQNNPEVVFSLLISLAETEMDFSAETSISRGTSTGAAWQRQWFGVLQLQQVGSPTGVSWSGFSK